MKALKNIGLSLLLLLVFTSNNFAIRNNSFQVGRSDIANSDESVQTPAIQNHTNPVYLEIEGYNYSPNITEVHRMASVSILNNRIVPVYYIFRRTTSLPKPVNANFPVPIFIRGHALLN